MIKLDIAKAAGAVDFDVQALDFFEVLATDVTKSQVDTVKIGKNQEVVVSLGVADSNTSFKIYGSFDVDGFDNKNPNQIEDTVKEINKIVVYEGKSEMFTLSGLKLKPEDLADGDALASYVGKQTFSLSGNDKANTLGGSLKNDTIDGAGGADTVTGNTGNDELTGGADADLFVFNAGDGNDVITDFRAKGGGQDHIDLSSYEITFEDLTFTQATKKTVLISFEEGTDTILIEGGGKGGQKVSYFDVGDFQF